MGMFDPQPELAPVAPMDYGVSNAKRQRLLADALRKQAGAATPEGQMVSGHYVAPSWAQHLATIAGGAGAGYMEGKAQEAEDASTRQATEARQKALSSLPKATEAVMSTRAEGLGGREKMVDYEAQAAKPLTHGDVFSKYAELAQIPGTADIAKAYHTSAMADITREDVQKERKEAAALSAVAQARKDQEALQFKYEQLQKESQRADLDRESRDANAAAQRALQAQIAAGSQGIQRMLAEAKLDKAKGGGDLDRLPAAQISAYVGNQKAAEDITGALKLLEANPNAVGYKGNLPDAALARYGTEGEKAARAALANIGSLKLHDRSGATVTVGEEPRLKPFIPDIRDPYDLAMRKMKNLRREAEKHNLTIEGFAEAGQYRAPGKTVLTPDDVLDTPVKAGGASPGGVAGGKVTQSLPTYKTQAEVDKLPPNTEFYGPDGKKYKKQ